MYLEQTSKSESPITIENLYELPVPLVTFMHTSIPHCTCFPFQQNHTLRVPLCPTPYILQSQHVWHVLSHLFTSKPIHTMWCSQLVVAMAVSVCLYQNPTQTHRVHLYHSFHISSACYTTSSSLLDPTHLRHNLDTHTLGLCNHALTQSLQRQPTQSQLGLFNLCNLIDMLQTNLPHRLVSTLAL